MPSDSVDLVDKDNAGRVFLALLEHVADTAGTNTDEHLDEVGTGNGEEGNIRLAGNRLGKKCLTCTRWSNEKHAFRDFATKTLELAGVLQELDNLLKLGLRLINAGDILECDTALMLGQQFGARLAKTHGTARSALHLSHEKYPDADEQQHREPGQQDRQEAWHAAVFRACDDPDVIGVQHLYNVGAFRHYRSDDPAILRGTLQITSIDDDLDNLLAFHFSYEVGIGKLASGRS